jgi:hypothetical protein
MPTDDNWAFSSIKGLELRSFTSSQPFARVETAHRAELPPTEHCPGGGAAEADRLGLGASPAATRLRLSATRRAANSLCRRRRKRRRTPSLRDSHPWRGVGLGVGVALLAQMVPLAGF